MVESIVESVTTLPPLPRENVYGHVGRLDWMKRHLKPEHHILEFGCGTGYMVTYPLRRAGFGIEGVDNDQKSIEYGSRAFCVAGEQPFLKVRTIHEITEQYDVVIASEVLEHLPTPDLHETVDLLRSRLRRDGLLLITVPNGYGWFELEQFFWYRLRIGVLIERSGLMDRLLQLRRLFVGNYNETELPATLSASGHVQRFTFGSIQRLLRSHGFRILEATGGAVLCGPFSNLFWTGIEPVMRWNIRLGRRMPRIAASFYIAAQNQGDVGRGGCERGEI